MQDSGHIFKNNKNFCYTNLKSYSLKTVQSVKLVKNILFRFLWLIPISHGILHIWVGLMFCPLHTNIHLLMLCVKSLNECLCTENLIWSSITAETRGGGTKAFAAASDLVWMQPECHSVNINISEAIQPTWSRPDGVFTTAGLDVKVGLLCSLRLFFKSVCLHN